MIFIQSGMHCGRQSRAAFLQILFPVTERSRDDEKETLNRSGQSLPALCIDVFIF